MQIKHGVDRGTQHHGLKMQSAGPRHGSVRWSAPCHRSEAGSGPVSEGAGNLHVEMKGLHNILKCDVHGNLAG